MKVIIAVLNKRGENATETAVAMLKILKPKNAEVYGIASPYTVKMRKTVDALQSQDVESHVIIGYVFSKTLSSDEPQPIGLENAALAFDGRIYSSDKEISDAETFAKPQQKCEETAKTLIKKIEGDFAFIIAEPERLIAGRDAIGVRPLYYGENADFAALASERKALWKIGIEKVDSFPSGHLALIDKNGFQFEPVKTFTYSKPKQMTLQSATKQLQTLLQHSVKERVLGLTEVAVAFSGGLDSSIIAFLAKNSGVNVHLIHVSLENQPETDYAKKAAEELKLPIHIYLYKEEDIEEILPDVLWLVEEPDPLKIGIGIPVYWTAEKAAKMNFKVMLAGQGADELFGGYKRYLDNYSQYGDEKVQKTIFNDICKMYETNFERDFKICNFHNMELRLPFATYQIAKFAIGLPLELKTGTQNNTLRKLVLRCVAANLGLPQFIVEKPKRAIQYTTGTSKILKNLAKRKGLPVKKYLQDIFQSVLEKRMLHE
jgi:asparagine synthase (glutamine-hydrolysing)